MDLTIHKANKISGEITVPGDKSISHRAVMLGALSEGTTLASHFLMSADCISTISCFRKMGVEIDVDKENDSVRIEGRGLHGLKAPSELLYTGNSGTTTRIISGILAGQNFSSELDGDESIRTRPMSRIITPLTRMGGSVVSMKGNGCCPLKITGKPLHAVHYVSPVASAQVKSCVLFAGLYADGVTSVTEPALSRDHTERMLSGFGAEVSSVKTEDGWTASVVPGPVLRGQTVEVPGDISSAAYFIAAALILPDSEVLIKNVGINPTRAGILKAVSAMGGNIQLENERLQGGEPVADLVVRSSSLHGTVIGGDMIPTLIDELPVCAVLAAFAGGRTVIRDASELKVKESDRIDAMTSALRFMGADVTATDDGMIIDGGRPLHGSNVDSRKDHRIAMSLAVAALAADGETNIKDAGCVGISYPEFYRDLEKLSM